MKTPPARPPATRPRRGGRRPAAHATGPTRDTILAAARREFATHGYAGAGVDAIALEAGVNKAMIYYHFGSKATLYHVILRELFERAGDEIRAIAASVAHPADKLDAIVDRIVGHLSLRPDLPPIMMREIAEGARHLDPEMLAAMSGLYRSVTAVLAEGQASGAFGPADPLLTYFTLVGPLVMFQAGAPVRRAMSRLKDAGSWEREPDAIAAHLKRVLRSLLTGSAAEVPPARTRAARPVSSEKRA